MNAFTVHDIVKEGPCPDYPIHYLNELWNGKKSLTAREIFNLDIPVHDREWALVRLLNPEIVAKWVSWLVSTIDIERTCTGRPNEETVRALYNSAVNNAYRANNNLQYLNNGNKDSIPSTRAWIATYATRAASEVADLVWHAQNKCQFNHTNTLLTKLIEMHEEQTN